MTTLPPPPRPPATEDIRTLEDVRAAVQELDRKAADTNAQLADIARALLAIREGLTMHTTAQDPPATRPRLCECEREGCPVNHPVAACRNRAELWTLWTHECQACWIAKPREFRSMKPGTTRGMP